LLTIIRARDDSDNNDYVITCSAMVKCTTHPHALSSALLSFGQEFFVVHVPFVVLIVVISPQARLSPLWTLPGEMSISGRVWPLDLTVYTDL